ncbi:dTDP-4-dehydrorhamnose 3%2C5-epimerase [Segatella copri]|nr:dTDP-4-dehydrorhamnose 3%2C5-epimerase [Segatella copri]
MKYTETEIEGVWLIEPRVFEDARGYFFEAWKQADFDAHVGGHVEFVQDNESMSARGVLRGLHYQKGEFSQAKLVRVIKGRVLDVAIDLRKENKRQFFIPRGFAHGFLVLSDEVIFTYKVDNVYAPDYEASIHWDDPTIGIKWPIEGVEVLTSEKDRTKAKSFEEADYFE